MVADLLAVAAVLLGTLMLGILACFLATPFIIASVSAALDELHEAPDHDGPVGPQPFQHRDHDRKALARHEVEQDLGAIAQVHLIGRWPEMARLLEDEAEREAQRAGDAFAVRGLRPYPGRPLVDRRMVHPERAGEIALEHGALLELAEQPGSERALGTGRHWIRLLTDPEGCWGAGCAVLACNDTGLRAGAEGSW